MKSNGLSKKERHFCELYSRTRSTREAAFRAGFVIMPERAAEKLLAREDILGIIADIDKKRAASTADIAAGLRRAAFGSVTDAIRLMLDDEISRDDIEGLDLFCVTEIKRPKGGGLEIKFVDRLKALEKLYALAQSNSEKEQIPFVQALENSAKAVFSDANA